MRVRYKSKIGDFGKYCAGELRHFHNETGPTKHYTPRSAFYQLDDWRLGDRLCHEGVYNGRDL